MAEPTLPASAGVVAVGVALLGPAAGPYAAIVLGSLAGALWALAAASTERKRDGAWLLLRLMLTAVVLTVGVSVWIEQRYGLPARDVLPGVAFVLGMGPERWRAVITTVADLRRRFGQPPAGGDGGQP